MPRTKRKDKSRVVLRTGESQRADGTYHFSWTDANHKRRYVYAKTLDELRYKEEQIAKDKSDGIKAEARYTTVNDIYELWKDLKRGLKNNTFENYKYMYETFVRHQIGSKTVSSLRKTDIKRFYNYLADERHLKPATIDNIHTVLHQILDMAVDDDYIRNNPSNNVLKELKQSHCFQTEKRRALTKPEQELFLDYLKNSPTSKYWYPVFAVMIGTGLRVGEVTGLRWCDIDLEEGIIDVNHTLVYYDHRTEGSKRGCYFNVNTTKTPAGRRKVPMLGFVKEAFLMEKERQELLDPPPRGLSRRCGGCEGTSSRTMSPSLRYFRIGAMRTTRGGQKLLTADAPLLSRSSSPTGTVGRMRTVGNMRRSLTITSGTTS